jgi:biotin carboxylase
VVVASEGRHSIVSAYAQGLHLEFNQPDAALDILLADAADNGAYAGVIATDDTTIELGAAVAARLGLPHNPPAAARFARRKDFARARLAEAGVRVPRHWRVDMRRSLATQMETVEYPCVLKPVALSASRGVIRADNPQAFRSAAARIARILAEIPAADERDHLLVERFVSGREVAVEGMLKGGRLSLLAIFDKPDPLEGPFFEETYYITPSRLTDAEQADLLATISRACKAYGLREGPVHAECRINADGVWVLEVAARTIGGLCARLFRLGSGYGLEEFVLAQAMGHPLDPKPLDGAAGILMIPIPAHGILRRVEGVGAARKVPYLEEVIIDAREGYELVPLPEGASYLGFMFARGPSPDVVEEALRRAHRELDVVIAPLWKGVTQG